MGYLLSGLKYEADYNAPVILSLRIYFRTGIWIPSKITRIIWKIVKHLIR